MHIVYSTITCDTDYVSYHPARPTDASARIQRRIRIRGGANLAPITGQLITPRGVATIVNDDELAFLETNAAFCRHREAGFIRVDKGNKPKDADIVAKEMTPKDASAPITKDTIAKTCGENTKDVKAVVQPTESSKARMK